MKIVLLFSDCCLMRFYLIVEFSLGKYPGQGTFKILTDANSDFFSSFSVQYLSKKNLIC